MDWTDPITVEEMYGEWPIGDAAIDAALGRSQAPRSSSSLYETVGETGIGPDWMILDIGARDARHALNLIDLYGCRAVAVDPVEVNIANASAAVADHEHGARVDIRMGGIEAIPADDGEFDLVFCRDMFNHILDTKPALQECRRVLKADGRMVVYQTFATDLLEPGEAIRIYSDLAVVMQRMNVEDFERRALQAGFIIESVDPIGSEWREAWEEDGTGRTSRQLLHAARLLRAKDALIAELGEVPYRVELSNALWGIYQMIGKLEPRVYVLRSP